ncbi:MAG: hypothetical protein JOZ96_13665 [Acidobacteria bacterium]|nr:hypothetical protein [Acidobacteriota bacterium]
MKRVGVSLFCLVLCGLCLTRATAAQGDDISRLVGNWSGESVCVNREKFPACKDEQVIYRVVVAEGKSDTVTVTADKLVNGKPETMGVIDFVYDARKQTITGEFKNSRVHVSLEFVVKGDTLEGGFYSLPDRTQVRRVKVQKDK